MRGLRAAAGPGGAGEAGRAGSPGSALPVPRCWAVPGPAGVPGLRGRVGLWERLRGTRGTGHRRMFWYIARAGLGKGRLGT